MNYGGTVFWTHVGHWCQLKTITSAQSLDPPKSPFKRGTLINILSGCVESLSYL